MEFKVGDLVERIGVLTPDYMKRGVITKVLPNSIGIEWTKEYEVDFGSIKAVLYHTQLRLVPVPPQDPPKAGSGNDCAAKDSE